MMVQELLITQQQPKKCAKRAEVDESDVENAIGAAGILVMYMCIHY